ncbi:MAG: hypothetical protein HW419_1497 [Deltaproteobacteria bacterium]|jgi:hypothetical protein|nr:hypothetical protein [Deltaproteobacteria bacterium]
MIKTPNFVPFVSFVVKTFFLIWLRLCRAGTFVVTVTKYHVDAHQYSRPALSDKPFVDRPLSGCDFAGK